MKTTLMNEYKEKIVLENEYQKLIEVDNHFNLISKYDRICVLPYTINNVQGLLDKIGIILDKNVVTGNVEYALIVDYLKTDDPTNLLAANRILFDIIGTNVTSAINWMYLGNIFNSLSSDSPIKLYAVDVSDIQMKTEENIENEEERKKFKFLDTSRVLQTDDMLFLSAYTRLFQYFYINSLDNQK